MMLCDTDKPTRHPRTAATDTMAWLARRQVTSRHNPHFEAKVVRRERNEKKMHDVG